MSPNGEGFQLDFEGDDWVFFGGVYQGVLWPQRPILPLFATTADVCDAALAVAGWGYGALFVLTVPLMKTRYGPWTARAALAAAVVFTAAAEAQTIEWFDNDLLGGGVVMLFLSGTFVAVGWVNEWLRREERVRRRVCLTCGYDLRASPDRCPECGAAVPRRAGAGSDHVSNAGSE